MYSNTHAITASGRHFSKVNTKFFFWYSRLVTFGHLSPPWSCGPWHSRL